ncbi:hypothetical protein AK830_g11040 [Neonectria ditissima]|uniref:Peptidase A1 domain-containing protein n=1 Tax=Neonectria ditissima TaxID=78410 RepID=A0A0P7B2C9_9HYPO|nr:hypothetical protein AK830_g11040 [Neonectria ditissima]
MPAMSWAFLSTAVVALIAVAAAERVPREVTWTDDTFGPDGPWRAVNVQMGVDGAPLGLYPGSTWETWLIEDDYCDGATCYASKAGTYDKSSGDQGGILLDGGLSGFMLGLELEGHPGKRYMDDMSLNGITAESVSLVLLDSQNIKYPGGQTSPFFAGCLSLGGSGGTNQSFTGIDDAPAINASLPPGWLWEREWTASNSFGMHIGSVQPAMSGSLWFGGYDQNRIVGEILSMNGSPRNGITLRDLSIEVIGSKSPFTFDSSRDGLLAKGNSSIGSGLKVSIDGCSPYLTLPKSTCDSIAANLPMHFDEDLGLYLWDTKSDKYEEIITSATALSFSFISGSNTDVVKIRVPFLHLNLTLTSPLVDTPTPYFPCHVNGKGQYVLGRAFLQDAFVGANWHRNANTWWLAQAPGRVIQSTTNVISIEEKDKTISKGGNDWKASWSGVWNEDGEEAPSSTSTSAIVDKDGHSGMRTGIGIGITAAVLALGIGTFFFWHRNRASQSQKAAHTLASEAAYTATSTPKWPPGELDSQEMPPIEMPSLEMPSYYDRPELP